jgi:hypothetical protein
MIYRHRRRPRNLAQKIRLALLSQLIGLGDLSGLLDGLTTVVRPRRQYRRLLAPSCASCGYRIAIADILSSFGTPHAEIITQTGIPITRSLVVSERELFCSDSERTKAQVNNDRDA